MDYVDMEEIRAIDIWNRVDELRPGHLTELCKKAQIPYARIKRNRTDCRIPSAEDLYAIASVLGTSVEYLLTGSIEKQPLYISPEAQAVEDSPELQALVRAVMRDPQLLQVISAVVTSSEKTIGLAR